jgi:RNA polymerase sigma-70 factor (ECF subfamily)
MAMNTESFQRIHDNFRFKIQRFLNRIVDEADAEDLTQEVFVKVYKAMPGFRGESSLSTWIYRIAANTAFDHIRNASSRRTSQHDDVFKMEEFVSENAMTSENVFFPDTQLIRKDMSNCIRGIVDSLPELYRTTLIQSDLEGLTNAEIAEARGISLYTVKIRIHRGRTKLRKAINNRCVLYCDSRNELACDRKISTKCYS